jgi:hypothetical protein
MGQATDGIVFWGVAFTDSDEEVNARISEVVDGDEDTDLYGDGREWLEPLGLFGKVEFVQFCSMTAPMWGIAATGTVTTAHRGWVKPLDLPQYPLPGWSIDVQTAVEALGQDIAHGEYGWKLVAFWEI